MRNSKAKMKQLRDERYRHKYQTESMVKKEVDYKHVKQEIMEGKFYVGSLKDAREASLSVSGMLFTRSYSPPSEYKFTFLSMYIEFVLCFIGTIAFGYTFTSLDFIHSCLLVLVTLPLWLLILLARIYSTTEPVRLRRKKIAQRRKLHAAYFRRKGYLKSLQEDSEKELRQVNYKEEIKALDDEFNAILADGAEFVEKLKKPVCDLQKRSALRNPTAITKQVMSRAMATPETFMSPSVLKEEDKSKEFSIAGLRLAPAPIAKPYEQIDIDL